MNGGPITRLGLIDESPEQRRERLLVGVFGALFRQVPQAVLVSIVGGMALVAVFWHTHDQTELIIWFIALQLEALLRLRSAHAFSLGGISAKEMPKWALRWLWMTATAGAIWGTAGLHFYPPESTVLQLVLVAVILAVAFGSLTVYASYTSALYIYLPLALFPIIWRMLSQHDPSYYTGAAIMLAVLAFTAYFGRNFGRTVADSIKGNLENEILVRQLLAEKRIAEDARRAAEAATRSKTKFFAAASHDLRQPLQAIGIYCSLLRKRAQGPLVPLVRNLSTGVETLSKLVEELLEISRLDSGAIQPQVESASLADLFIVLQREFLPLAAAKRLDLRIRPTRLHVMSDPLLLSRVLRNLLTNAVRYTARGGVLLAARRRGDVVHIEVWDTGPGIHEQELGRVFEEFYRGESSKSEVGSAVSTGGFGLGLSIVRRICNVLGHQLTVRTRPGSGTMFRVAVARSAQTNVRRSTASESAESAIQPIAGQCIVVLEDNEAILNSLTRLLRSWGANVISSTGFTGALVKRLGHDRSVDLIIADQNLGGPIDGAEAVFRIRELIGVPVPVIMLTAVGTLDLLAEFQHQMQLRMAHNPEAANAIARSRVEEPIVLTKPADASVLNARILTALGIAPMDPATLARNQNVAEGREERIL
ncbi:MAG TPA: hybrid sensor histidine kinase/response regulator [Burkholderiaceae bacterium]|nr:hybrid sensor histidine kinase/response regulator [Burkholderiaceae bacterium]